ncbi:hypothetical protein BJY17_000737 [Agromyces hippuratus]|uniref:Uncharacterized protein n=1 Tax=Agromyces hippuratus TaxID=286438 RepID=A0A852WUL2_9MICO|nr:hypothetical protein [Agromyces hippuratus]NYG19990.1 hypothetical protein [Agromyces hippuratus]
MDFVNWFKPYRDQLVHAIGRLDGTENFAFKLGALPEGKRFNELGSNGWRPDQYVQCAGRADALAIEVRRQNLDGSFSQLAVGRGGPRDGEPVVRVPYGDGHSVLVYDDEVFGQAEAVEIFHRYFQTGEVGEAYMLREIDLG